MNNKKCSRLKKTGLLKNQGKSEKSQSSYMSPLNRQFKYNPKKSLPSLFGLK